MNWVTRVRNALPFVAKRETAETLWQKCKGCEAMIFLKEYEENHSVCPKCDHHGRIGPAERFAAIFDEVLGFAQALSGAPGMTGRLEVTYRSPTPLHQPLKVTGRFDGINGRKIMTSAEIYASDRLCAQAVRTFISVKTQQFAALNNARQTRE